MTELQKYELINSCESVEELQGAIDQIWSGKDTAGKCGNLTPERMKSRVPEVVEGLISANVLTRQYGLRQQALYLAYYLQFERAAQRYFQQKLEE